MSRDQQRHTSVLPQGRASTPAFTPKAPRASLEMGRQPTPGEAPPPPFHSPKAKHNRRSSLLDGSLDPKHISIEKREALVRPAAILALEALLEAGTAEEGPAPLTARDVKLYKAFESAKAAHLVDSVFVDPAALERDDRFADAIKDKSSTLNLLVALSNLVTFTYLILSSAPDKNGYRTAKRAQASFEQLRQAATAFIPFVLAGEGQLNGGILKMLISIKQQAFIAYIETNVKPNERISVDDFWSTPFEDYANEARLKNRQSAYKFLNSQKAVLTQIADLAKTGTALAEAWPFERAAGELVAYVSGPAQTLRQELVRTQPELSSADEDEDEEDEKMMTGDEVGDAGETQETDDDEGVERLLMSSARQSRPASSSPRKPRLTAGEDGEEESFDADTQAYGASAPQLDEMSDDSDEEPPVDSQRVVDPAALAVLNDDDSESDASDSPAPAPKAKQNKLRIGAGNKLERVSGQTPKAKKLNARQADAQREQWDSQAQPTPMKVKPSSSSAVTGEDGLAFADPLEFRDYGGGDGEGEASFVPVRMAVDDNDDDESQPPRFTNLQSKAAAAKNKSPTKANGTSGFTTPQRATVATPARPSAKSKGKRKQKSASEGGEEGDPAGSHQVDAAEGGEEDAFDEVRSDEDEAAAAGVKKKQASAKKKRTTSQRDGEAGTTPVKRAKKSDHSADGGDPDDDPVTRTVNYYRQDRNGPGNRIKWEQAETDCLIEGMKKFANSTRIWGHIIAEHGPQGTESKLLANRNNVSIKDKAVNIKKDYINQNRKVPSWLERVAVPKALREKEEAQANARRAARRAAALQEEA